MKLQCCIQTPTNVVKWFVVKLLYTLFVFIIFTRPYTICSELKSDEYNKLQEKKAENIQKHVKFILRWDKSWQLNIFEDKQKVFMRRNCPEINCYVTTDRNFFGGDLKKFDAIIFNGPSVTKLVNDLPKQRYSHQKYIFHALESGASIPICHSVFDDFFNWTYTYRLDSDLLFPYFHIKDMNGNIVGPKPNMDWRYADVHDMMIDSLWKNKNKAAAWMTSHCNTVNEREKLANVLFYELQKAGLTLDVFGRCGTKSCPLNNMTGCWELIKNEYYFYLSFENSHSIDYVTEKLLFPLDHYTIPIVFGGADYSRFLPPLSYLDAKKMNIEELVSKMKEIINSKELYKQYFRWRSTYKYDDASTESICRLCSALHDEGMMSTSTTHKHFRKWWNPENFYCMGESEDVMYKTKVIKSVKIRECSKNKNIFSKMLCHFATMMQGIIFSPVVRD